ncbi:MAG: glutamate dehydrogenase, partial [Proteobacteria bacterium]|nr:glutamate dehydrogenase [Pseudomonadota bacterium]
KMTQMGGKVITLSDSRGFIHDPEGMTQEKIDWVKVQKTVHHSLLSDYENKFKGSTWHAGEKPWSVPCDIALPCATQNEVNGAEAKELIRNGCMAVSEGANMPVDLDGVHLFKEAGICYAPGKAANAGGVAISGLEMSQNSARLSWPEEQLQQQLKDIMKNIHDKCVEYGELAGGRVDYVRGANIAGFVKVADAMIAYGVV